MKLSETIRRGRKERNWTQAELAERLGVTASAVHKWETGASCPDIALLPPLARLLGTDLNALLSFREDLTQQEIGLFLQDLRQVMETEGYDAGFRLALDKTREYPSSGLLASTVALFLEGALVLYPPAEDADYRHRIEGLYRQASASDCPSAREQATVMLIFRHADRGDWSQAEELLETLPQAPAFSLDRESVAISLLLRKQAYATAAERIEAALLRHIAQVNTLLPQLLTALLETGETDDAAAVAQVARKLGEDLDLPPVVTLALPLSLALREKDAETSLALLEQILAGLGQSKASAAFTDSPLFRHLPAKQQTPQNAQASSSDPYLRAAFLTGLAQDEEAAFLRDQPGYAELLERFGT